MSQAELRVAAVKAREWTARRDVLVCELHAAGLSLRSVAILAGLSHAGVRRIVQRGSGKPGETR